VSAPTAVLYDVHGNLVALEAVLADAEEAGAASFVLGGDYASFGAWPRETAERLDALPAVVRIRGNVDRWLLEEPEAPPAAKSFLTPALAAAREALGTELCGRLHGLPVRGELDGVLVCHGSPLSDVESFAQEPHADDERLLAAESERTILFGHSHLQFRRDGPNGTRLVNPGSVGMPVDGDARAAWALYDDGGFVFRRTEYDVERAIARMRTLGGWAERIVYRLENAAVEPAE
jgi:diadenosine tetraphosphatase ApaH/serine/threonine PP2A family protein phosphatase